jgi:hypothetical protein
MVEPYDGCTNRSVAATASLRARRRRRLNRSSSSFGWVRVMVGVLFIACAPAVFHNSSSSIPSCLVVAHPSFTDEDSAPASSTDDQGADDDPEIQDSMILDSILPRNSTTNISEASSSSVEHQGQQQQAEIRSPHLADASSEDRRGHQQKEEVEIIVEVGGGSEDVRWEAPASVRSTMQDTEENKKASKEDVEEAVMMRMSEQGNNNNIDNKNEDSTLQIHQQEAAVEEVAGTRVLDSNISNESHAEERINVQRSDNVFPVEQQRQQQEEIISDSIAHGRSGSSSGSRNGASSLNSDAAQHNYEINEGHGIPQVQEEDTRAHSSHDDDRSDMSGTSISGSDKPVLPESNSGRDFRFGKDDDDQAERVVAAPAERFQSSSHAFVGKDSTGHGPGVKSEGERNASSSAATATAAAFAAAGVMAEQRLRARNNSKDEDDRLRAAAEAVKARIRRQTEVRSNYVHQTNDDRGGERKQHVLDNSRLPTVPVPIQQRMERYDHERGTVAEVGGQDTVHGEVVNHDQITKKVNDEEEFDDRTLLDLFGEAAKKYLTQRLVRCVCLGVACALADAAWFLLTILCRICRSSSLDSRH